MKKILMALMFVLMTTSALAYTQIWHLHSNVPFTGRTYLCDGECADGTLIPETKQEDHGSDVDLTFNGEATPENPDNYAIYYYPDGACYVPGIFSWGIWGNGEYDLDQIFGKQDADHCGSNVDDIDVDKVEFPVGETATVTANLQSAWGSDFDTIPADLVNYYDSFVTVTFSVNGVVKDTDSIRIGWNDWKEVEYKFTPTEPGDYTLRIATKMDGDCKCACRPSVASDSASATNGGAPCDRSNLKYQEVTVKVTEGEIPEFSTFGLVALTALIGLFLLKAKHY